jgi:hypothetical protein
MTTDASRSRTSSPIRSTCESRALMHRAAERLSPLRRTLPWAEKVVPIRSPCCRRRRCCEREFTRRFEPSVRLSACLIGLPPPSRRRARGVPGTTAGVPLGLALVLQEQR